MSEEKKQVLRVVNLKRQGIYIINLPGRDPIQLNPSTHIDIEDPTEKDLEVLEEWLGEDEYIELDVVDVDVVEEVVTSTKKGRKKSK